MVPRDIAGDDCCCCVSVALAWHRVCCVCHKIFCCHGILDTGLMLAEAEAASLDENFATIIIRDDEMKEYLKQHHDYRLLDQVITDFLSSNRHRRRN